RRSTWRSTNHASTTEWGKNMKLAFCGFRHPHIFTLYQHAQQHADIEIVAACEEDETTRGVLASEGKVDLTHQTLAALLAEVDCDTVAVGDYYAKRGALILQALAAGKHVIVDKPVCTSLSELDAIAQQLAAHNLKLGCMLDMRDSPQAIGLRKLIRSGTIGEIHAISFGGQHPLMLGSRASWYFEPGKHGGTINDIAIHAVDALPWITGLAFDKLYAARTWNAFAPDYPHFHDAAQMMLSLDNGCGVLGDVSYFMPDSMGYALQLYWRMTFWGRKGVIETSLNSDQIMIALDGEEQPRYEALPTGNPGGYLQAFLDDIAGVDSADTLNTQTILRSARVALQIQAAATEGQAPRSLG
ncbi:MAG: Gfo/Idh/MocA family oxidoreductase, partial [Caldilineaceae bacterium]|nr:Gfo/Idh/MocA family oxidoreductase [Caldilineaceae bacterium]